MTEERAGSLLLELGCTLATAESLTGGLVGARITAVAGSSDYYLGGVISYATAIKHSLLRVGLDILTTHGAVSEQTAAAMASGVRDLFKADIGLSTTGVAGPATQDGQPVGTLCVGIADASGVRTFRLAGPAGDRAAVREWAAGQAIRLLVERLEAVGVR